MDTQQWLALAALVAFNAPIVVTAWKLRKVNDLGSMLKEKDADGQSTGATSFSRVTGIIGAVVVASLFWVISNIVIAMAIIDPQVVSGILTDVTKLFLVGAALFLPYAFNQLKSLLQ